jgi:hypothetical protein
MVTFNFVPYQEIETLSSAKRVNKLMNIVKQNKIVLLEGRLKKEEEADLIEITMEEIGDKFKGIELAVIDPDKKTEGLRRLKYGIANLLLGDRQGITVIGPATIVKSIKRNPNSIELYTQEARKRKVSKRKRK